MYTFILMRSTLLHCLLILLILFRCCIRLTALILHYLDLNKSCLHKGKSWLFCVNVIVNSIEIHLYHNLD